MTAGARWGALAAPTLAAILTGAVSPEARAAVHAVMAAVLWWGAAPLPASVAGAWRAAAAWMGAAAVGLVPMAPWESTDPLGTVQALWVGLLCMSQVVAAAPVVASTPPEVAEGIAARIAVVWASAGAVHVAAGWHELWGVIPVRFHDGPLLAPLVNPNHHGTVLLLLWPSVWAELRRRGVGPAALPFALTLLWTAAVPWVASSMGVAVALGAQLGVAGLRTVRSAWWRGAAVVVAGAGSAWAATQAPAWWPVWWRLSGEPRLAQWADAGAMLRDHPWAGVGVGAYGVAYLPYRTVPAFASFDHAHSEPLQWAVEAGAVGLMAVAVSVWWAPRPSPGAGRGVWALGLLGGAVHACLDFPLRVPAVALAATVVWVAWMASGAPAPAPQAARWPRLAALQALACVFWSHLAVSEALAWRAARGEEEATAWLVHVAPWRPEALIGELRLGWRGPDAPVRSWAERAAAWPRDPTLPRLVAAAAVEAGDLELALAQVEASISRDPNDWRAWRLKATVLERRGDVDGAVTAFAEAMRHWPAEHGDGRAMAEAWALRPLAVVWMDLLRDAPAHWSARLASLLLREGQPYAALLAAEQAGRLRPEVHAWSATEVDALLELGWTERAAARVSAWLEARPDDPWGWYAAARVELATGTARWPAAVAKAGLLGMPARSVQGVVERCLRTPSCDDEAARWLSEAWAARGRDPVVCRSRLGALVDGRPAVRDVTPRWSCTDPSELDGSR